MGAAARATSYWRALVSRVGSGKERRKFTSSTVPRLSPNSNAATANAYAHEHDHKNKFLPILRGDFVPVYVSLGLVLLALTFATHTMKQQIERNPNVYVSKKKRSFPEVKDPDYAEKKSQEMINKSFFRRIAHIQDHYDYLQNNNPVPDTIRGDPIKSTRASHKSVSLKSVGVDP